MKELLLETPASVAAEEPATTVITAVASAMETRLMRVECSFTRGFAGLTMIGNTTEVCRDGKERARAALERLGIHIPPRRLVVSLTPADVKKDGNHFDLPIAVSLALLLAPHQPRGKGEAPAVAKAASPEEGSVVESTPQPPRHRPPDEGSVVDAAAQPSRQRHGGRGAAPVVDPARWMFAAEVGLLGELRPVKGMVSFAVAAVAAGLDGLVVAPGNLAEVEVLAAVGPRRERPLTVYAFATLRDVLAWLLGRDDPSASPPVRTVTAGTNLVSLPEPREAGATDRAASIPRSDPAFLDFDDMTLSPEIELAALVAATGRHSLLLRGSPGTGKSMLAARLPSILPTLDGTDHIDAMRIYSSFSETLPSSLLAGRPPFRAPHHQASAAAVLGADNPGEISLAHGGVLFLDELPEFRRDVLEALREPLETGEVRVSRSRNKLTWRARILLIAACNNCPCGWFGSGRRRCRCPMPRVLGYRQRLSGPILERIDLHVNMPESREQAATLFLRLAPGTTRTATMRARVEAAHARSLARNRRFGLRENRDLTAMHVIEASGQTEKAFAAMVNGCIPRIASSRVALRTLRVARTLADLDDRDELTEEHLEQAWRWQAEPSAKERGEELGEYDM